MGTNSYSQFFPKNLQDLTVTVNIFLQALTITVDFSVSGGGGPTETENLFSVMTESGPF